MLKHSQKQSWDLSTYSLWLWLRSTRRRYNDSFEANWLTAQSKDWARISSWCVNYSIYCPTVYKHSRLRRYVYCDVFILLCNSFRAQLNNSFMKCTFFNPLLKHSTPRSCEINHYWPRNAQTNFYMQYFMCL